MTISPLSLWVMSDGRRGIENQALGLAEAIARARPSKVHTQRITNHGLFKKASAGLQFSLKSKPKYYALSAPYPDIAIGCGRQAIAPLRALKAARGEKIFTIYIQDPRTDLAHFDLIIAPQHDGLSGLNVETMIGSPNRLTPKALKDGLEQFKQPLAALPAKKAALLIGGPSKAHTVSKRDHAEHIDAAQGLLAAGYGLMITTSRRTPDWVAHDYKALAKDNEAIWLYDGGEPNPYFAFLAASSLTLVTQESTNMLTEACCASAPVFRLPMSGKAGKFKHLYDALKTRSLVERYAGQAEDKNFTPLTKAPLNETARMAERALAHFDARGKALN